MKNVSLIVCNSLRSLQFIWSKYASTKNLQRKWNHQNNNHPAGGIISIQIDAKEFESQKQAFKLSMKHLILMMPDATKQLKQGGALWYQ